MTRAPSRWRRWVQRIPWATVVTDVGFAAGCAAFVYGVWGIYVPAAFMVAGAIVATVCVLAAGKRNRRPEEPPL